MRRPVTPALKSSLPIVPRSPNSEQSGSGALATLDRSLNTLYVVCGVLAGAAIVLIAVLVATSIVSRLVGVFIGGLTEGAGYAMAAAGSLGLAYTFGRGGHIRVDLGLSALRGSARTRVDQLALLLTAAAVCFLSFFFVRMVWISWSFGDLSDGSDRLPIWLPQFPAAVGFVVFAIALVHALVRYVFTGRSPLVVEEREPHPTRMKN